MRRRDGARQISHLLDGGLNVWLGRQPGKSGCQFQGVMTRGFPRKVIDSSFLEKLRRDVIGARTRNGHT